MTRAWWVAAVCLGFGVVPAAAQQTGSVGIQGGLSASGFRDLRCHENLLSMWEVLAVVRRTIVPQVLNHGAYGMLSYQG